EVGEGKSIEFVVTLRGVDLEHRLLELLEAVANGGRIRQLVESVAPCIGNKLSVENGAVPIVHGEGLESDFFCESERGLVFGAERGASGVTRSLVIHDVGVAAEVRLFFEQKKIALLQKVCRGESADAAAHDHYVMLCARWGFSECFPIAHLMADGVLFAI